MKAKTVPDEEAGLLAACALMAAQIAMKYAISPRRYSMIMREAMRLAGTSPAAGKGEQE